MRRSRHDLTPFIIPLVVLVVAVIAVFTIMTPQQWRLSATTQTNSQANLFGQATYTSPHYALDTDFFDETQRLSVSIADAEIPITCIT